MNHEKIIIRLKEEGSDSGYYALVEANEKVDQTHGPKESDRVEGRDMEVC